MTVVLDSRTHATAIRTAIKVQFGPNDVYDYDDVPTTPPDIFALVSVERRFNPDLKMSAQATTGGWRVAVRSLGTTVDEARWAMVKVTAALNEARLSIGGQTTTPIQFESDQAPVLDDSRYAGLSLWIYQL